jgi:hypothetical protein
LAKKQDLIPVPNVATSPQIWNDCNSIPYTECQTGRLFPTLKNKFILILQITSNKLQVANYN